MKRAYLFVIALVLLTVGVGAPQVRAAAPSRAPSFVEMQGFEAIDWPTDETKHLDFGAITWVRNVTGSKSTVLTVTFTVTFDVGAPVVRSNQVRGTRFGAANTQSPSDYNVAIPAGATSVTVDATLTKLTVKTGVTTTLDTMSSGPQRIYTMAEMLASPPTDPLFLVVAT